MYELQFKNNISVATVVIGVVYNEDIMALLSQKSLDAVPWI
ncbi:hypothetical protein [Desulfocicer niacini]